jgi:heptosyltransferase II
MRILIIQTAFIGDVVLATPVIEKLKEKFPHSEIDFLVRKGNENLVLNHPKLREVLIFDKKHGKYRNLVRLIKGIRQNKYDYVINLQRFLTTGIITAFSGARKTIGFNKNPLSFLFSYSVEHHIDGNIYKHEVERNLMLLKPLMGEVSITKPRLYPSSSDKAVIPADEKYIVIAPSSVWFTKQYPEERWSKLISLIPLKYKIYLTGGPGDLEQCQRIASKSGNPNIEILSGKLTFLQSAALISGAVMTFVNDSAPLHFASAVNAPVTAIFCSTIPGFGFGPLSDQSYVVETTESLACRPCNLHGKKECPLKHFKCSDIDEKSVLEISGILN